MAKEPEYFDFMGMQSKKTSDLNSLKKKSTFSPFSRADHVSKFCTVKRKKTPAPGAATKVQTKVTTFFNVDEEETNSGREDKNNGRASHDEIPVTTKSAAIVKRTLATANITSSTSNVPNSLAAFEDSSHYCVTTPAKLVKSLASIATQNNLVSEAEPTADLDVYRKQVIEKAQQALLQMQRSKDSVTDESLPIHIKHLASVATLKTSGRTKKSVLSSNTRCEDVPHHSDPVVETVEPVSVYEIPDTDTEDSDNETQLAPSDRIAVSTTEVYELVDNVQPSATDAIEETLVPRDGTSVDDDEIFECVQPSRISAMEESCLASRDSDGVEVGDVIIPKDSETMTIISSPTELAPESESCGTNSLDVEQSDDWSNISVTISTNVYLECSVSLDQQDDATETIDDDGVLLEDDSPGVDLSISVSNFDQQVEATETINDDADDEVLLEDDSPGVDLSIDVSNFDQNCATEETDDSNESQHTSSVEIPSCNSVRLYENMELPQTQEFPLLQSNEGVDSLDITEDFGWMQVDTEPVQLSVPENNVPSIQSQLQNETSCINENVAGIDGNEMITSSCHEVRISTNKTTDLENTQPTVKRRRLSSDPPSQKKCIESPHKNMTVKKWKAMKLNDAKTSGEGTTNSNLSLDNSASNQQKKSSCDKSAEFKLGLALDLELSNIFSIRVNASNKSLNVSQSKNGHVAPYDMGEKDNVKLNVRPDIQNPISETSVCPAQESTKIVTSELESTTKIFSNGERLKPKSYPNIIPLNIYLKFYNWYNNEWKAKDLDDANVENREPVCSCACSLCDCFCHCKEKETKKLLHESQGALEEFFSGVEEWMQSSNREIGDIMQGNLDNQKTKVAKEQKRNPLSIKTRKRNVIPENLFQGLPEKRPIKPPTWHSTYLDVPLRTNNDIPSIDIMDCNPSAYRRSCTVVNENQFDKLNLLDAYKSVHSVFNPLKEISNNVTKVSNNVAPKCKTPKKATRKENPASQNNAPIKKKAKKPNLRFYSVFHKKRRRKSPSKPNNGEGPSSTKRGKVVGSSKNVPQNLDGSFMKDHTQPSLEVGESHLDFNAQYREQEENVEWQPTLSINSSENIFTDEERNTNTNSGHKNLDTSRLAKRVSKKQSKKQTKKKHQIASGKALNFNPDDRVGQSSEIQYRKGNTVRTSNVPSTSRMIESREVDDIAPQRPHTPVTRLHRNEFESQALSTLPPDTKTIVHAIQHNKFRGSHFAASKFGNILSALNLSIGGEAGSKSSIEDVYKEDDHDVVSERNPLDEIQYQVDCAILRDSLDRGIRRTDEECIIRRLFFAQKDYLKSIMSGRMACARHKEFSHSTVSPANMPDFSVMVFTELTLIGLLDLMTDELNNPDLRTSRFHYESRSLFRNYYWNVLIPELIIKIFMDAYGISKYEAHRKITNFQCDYKFDAEMHYFLE